MRLLNSIKNSLFGFFSQIILMFLGFFSRYAFVYFLGEVYLGVNGLFTNIISILSLTELGFGNAALFALYKPLAKNDKRKITALMNFYSKVYKLMFILVIVIGLALIPLLPYLINDMPEIEGIYFIYILFVLNSGISYLFSYKRSIIYADQKNYKIVSVNTMVRAVTIALQIAVLYLSRNYILYLTLSVFSVFIENLIISKIAERNYPYINQKNEKLDDISKREIVKNTKSLFMHKIGTIAVFSTDNIIISAFVNLASVGLYSNYTLIVGYLDTFIKTFIDGIKASFGSFNSNESIERRHEMFLNLNFIIYWIYSFCFCCLVCLINPFISLWLGDKYVFEYNVVILICFNFFIQGMRQTFHVTKETSGIFSQDRYKSIFEAIVNLTVSIALVQLIGLPGVLIGTTISTLMLPYTIEPYVTYKYIFNDSPLEYYKILIKNVFTLFIITYICFYCCEFINFINPMISFMLKCIFLVIIINILNCLLYYNNKQFKYYKNLIKDNFLKFIEVIKNRSKK